jgi:hypothetical protein
MDWRDLRHLARTFGLSKLVKITGVPKDRIHQWQRIGAWSVEPLGRGKVRKYDIWDAIRATLIQEFSHVGRPISGKGEDLVSALVGVVIYAASSGPGDLSNLPEQVIPYRDAEKEWYIDIAGSMALDDERPGNVVMLIRLRRIALEVGERSVAAIGT